MSPPPHLLRHWVLQGHQGFLQLSWEWCVNVWSEKIFWSSWGNWAFSDEAWDCWCAIQQMVSWVLTLEGNTETHTRAAKFANSLWLVGAYLPHLGSVSAGNVCFPHQESCQHSQLGHKQDSRFWLIQIGTIQTVTKRDLSPEGIYMWRETKMGNKHFYND